MLPYLLPSSWTSVSSRTRLSTSLSASKAASDQWGCSWWRRVRSRSSVSRWWPSQTHHPTPSKCTECCAGKNMLISYWEKRFLEISCCGEWDKTCDWLWWALTDWTTHLKFFIDFSWRSWWIVPLAAVKYKKHIIKFWPLKVFIWLIYILSYIYNFIKADC